MISLPLKPFFSSFLSPSGCEKALLEINSKNRLKTAANKDLRLFENILGPKFGAKIRGWE